MRNIQFTMARAGLVAPGDLVEITEGKLPGSYYYTIEPAVAMSGNFLPNERLNASQGKVVDVKETKRGFFVTVEIEE